MKKNVIGINVTVKDAKKIVEAANLIAQIFTPTEETPIAVITEAAPVKKAAAKKATKVVEEKPAKKTKKSSLKKITVGSLHRITLPHNYLDATGARGGMVDVLRKYGKTNAIYFIPAGADYNMKKYGFVKTVDFNNAGQVAIGRLLKGVNIGDEVRVDLVENKIVIRK